jgi:uncharacterized protein (TIGR03437 family)
VRGIGGLLTLDAQGNLYVAGALYGANTSIPTTPGAIQNTHGLQPCGGSGQLAFACSYQYVTKFNPGLTRIIYATYLTGTYGAAPASISVDPQGNVWVAGTTNSPDYPVTPNAYQPLYLASAPPPPGNSCMFSCVSPPAATGYITELNTTGTGLIYSTFFGGTETDNIGFAVFSTNGVYIAGTTKSPDLPGFAGFPAQCLPQTYATRLSTDATEVGAARQVPGQGQVLAYDGAANALIVWTGSDLVTFDPAAPPNSVACILDAADLMPVTSVAPGELLSIFGQRLTGSVIAQASGQFATSLDGITVAVNGIPSPLLYASPQQINFQVPFEVAGAAQASIAFTNAQASLSDSRTLVIVGSDPVAFIDTTTSISVLASCPLLGGLPFYGKSEPLAFNADGARNSCANPAAPGSVVQIFLGGLGVTSPAQATGTVVPNPGPTLNVPITFAGGLEATAASVCAPPGLISGVWQVNIGMPTNQTGAVLVSPSVSGVPVRDTSLIIWVH